MMQASLLWDGVGWMQRLGRALKYDMVPTTE